MLTPTDSNEPYTEWLDFVLSQKTLPQTISTSYADDEQTGMLCAFCGKTEKVDIFASLQFRSASPSASATDLHSSVSCHARMLDVPCTNVPLACATTSLRSCRGSRCLPHFLFR